MGISKFHKLNHILGLETRDLESIVETVDCLHLLSHKILTHSGRELRAFLEFAKWMRHEIDMQAAEPMSQTLEELMEKSDMIDHSTTLEYIQGALTRSYLRHFIPTMVSMPGGMAAAPAANKWIPGGQDGSFYEAYRKALAIQEQQEIASSDGSPLDLPKLNDFTGRLSLQCKKVFGQVALTQRRGILHRCPLVLHPDCDHKVIDTVMSYDGIDGGDLCSIYVAAKLKNTPHICEDLSEALNREHDLLTFPVYIYRVSLESINGVSSTKGISVAALSLRQGTIRQIQFVDDDNTVMILFSDAGKFLDCCSGSYSYDPWRTVNADSTIVGRSFLINFPFLPSPPSSRVDVSAAFSPSYTPIDPARDPVPEPSILDLGAAHAGLVLHCFPPSGANSTPLRISVNGRKARRAICVLFADGLHYEVLDMDGRLHEVEEGQLHAEGLSMSES